ARRSARSKRGLQESPASPPEPVRPSDPAGPPRNAKKVKAFLPCGLPWRFRGRSAAQPISKVPHLLFSAGDQIENNPAIVLTDALTREGLRALRHLHVIERQPGFIAAGRKMKHARDALRVEIRAERQTVARERAFAFRVREHKQAGSRSIDLSLHIERSVTIGNALHAASEPKLRRWSAEVNRQFARSACIVHTPIRIGEANRRSIPQKLRVKRSQFRIARLQGTDPYSSAHTPASQPLRRDRFAKTKTRQQSFAALENRLHRLLQIG